MLTTTPEPSIHSLQFSKEIPIEASMQIVFDSILEQLGQGSELEEGPMPMMLEPWPGGRWYRDLGEGKGHLWGHVQVIKPPTLIEITGPLFMSYAAVSHIQYRVKAMENHSLLTFTHRAMGQIPAEHREGVSRGWSYGLNRIREIAECREDVGE